MAGDPGDAPEVGEGGIRSVLTMGSLVDPSGNEVIVSLSSCSTSASSVVCLCSPLFSASSDLAFDSKVHHSFLLLFLLLLRLIYKAPS